MSQQSQPYAAGGTVYNTYYHYDASGRTTSVVQPDNSTTTYLYQGNTVKVTDPASKWKTFTMDAFGNLISVLEPDPSLGNVTTSYTYDILNHLTGVSMPRGTTTQTRTFNYNSGTTVTAFLQSATNPENGTVTYTYNSFSKTLASKTDAKGQTLLYAYDGYNRLTTVTLSPSTVLRTYSYDTNPLDSTHNFSQYASGRLTAVQYTMSNGIPINEQYSYTQAGLPATKRVQVSQPAYLPPLGMATPVANLDTTFAYNNEGKVTSMTYPSASTAGPTYNYTYDSMYRLNGMTDSNNNTIVTSVSYNAANQMLGMWYNGTTETRTYNSLNQLTNIVASLYGSTTENLTYNYPAATNNGKLSSMYNAISGETVTYTYDSLNRLLTAGGSGWGESYGIDPFGNLLTKTVTSGSGPSMSLTVNANNQIGGVGFDANGNAQTTTNGGNTYGLGYDVENRVNLVASNGFAQMYYGYDSQNHRIWSWNGATDSAGNAINYTVNVYTPTGQKIGAYTLRPFLTGGNGNYQAVLSVTLATTDQYFGSRRLAVLDQLGSAGTYFPWGEAKGTTNPQDTWSYATYWRDSVSGLDYANNRYYSNAYGRFMTPDPYIGSVRLMNPSSWNRYAYTNEDPVNHSDPSGLDVNCAIVEGQYICIDTTWGETIDVPNQTSLPWTTLDQWFQAQLASALNSIRVVKKSYDDVQPCSFTASQVISYISNNFGQFGNFSTVGPGGIGESVTFSPPSGPLTVGENIPITIQVGGSTFNISVDVASVTSNSISFTTTEGHLLYPGAITFSATDVGNGSFTFSIDLAGLLSSPSMGAAFLFGGGAFEDAQWDNFLNQVGLLCDHLPTMVGGGG